MDELDTIFEKINQAKNNLDMAAIEEDELQNNLLAAGARPCCSDDHRSNGTYKCHIGEV